MARVFDEQFENTGTPGYDETAAGAGSDWAETVGGGATVDENQATGGIAGAPADWDDECLYIDTNAVVTDTLNTLDSLMGEFWLRVEVIIISEALSNNDQAYLIIIKDSEWDFIAEARLTQDASGNLKFKYRIDAGFHTSTVNLSLDTRYRLELYYNSAGGWEWRLDGNTEFSDTSTAQGGLRQIVLGDPDGSVAYEVAFDNIAIDDADWIGAVGVAPTGALYGPLVGPMGGPI